MRVALAALVFAFAVNVFAHSAHTHDDAVGSSVHAACGYCAAFDSVIAPPTHAQLRVGVHFFTEFDASYRDAAFLARPFTSATTRGPPRA